MLESYKLGWFLYPVYTQWFFSPRYKVISASLLPIILLWTTHIHGGTHAIYTTQNPILCCEIVHLLCFMHQPIAPNTVFFLSSLFQHLVQAENGWLSWLFAHTLQLTCSFWQLSFIDLPNKVHWSFYIGLCYNYVASYASFPGIYRGTFIPDQSTELSTEVPHFNLFVNDFKCFSWWKLMPNISVFNLLQPEYAFILKSHFGREILIACCRKSGTFALAGLLQNKVEQIFFSN